MNQTVIAELRAQHEVLTVLMDRCQELADRLDADLIEPAPVLEAVAELRTKLAAHNQYEEGVLPPELRDVVDEHAAEHRAMFDDLENPITRELRATIARLRRHIGIEERYFDQ